MIKNPLTAFILSFIPGAGHAYLGRPVRTVVYGASFFGPLGLLLIIMMTGGHDREAVFLMLGIAFLGWTVNMIDMIVSLINGKAFTAPLQSQNSADPAITMEQQREKTHVILLSLIPGLGHMHIGLMHRGLSFLISFIGLSTILLFLVFVLKAPALLIFLLILPVIWIYNMFDAMQCLSARHRYEPLHDRTIFHDLESHVSTGRKIKVLALALSVFPGAGHLYLGLQLRGLQLMGGFLLAIYIMDNFRLTLFFFLIPLLWCFAFFDALHQATRYERGELRDEPVLTRFTRYQKWIGIGLLGFGAFYLIDQLATRYMAKYAAEWYRVYLEFKYMFPAALVAFIMIAIGLRLIFGNKAATKQERLELTWQEEDRQP